MDGCKNEEGANQVQVQVKFIVFIHLAFVSKTSPASLKVEQSNKKNKN